MFKRYQDYVNEEVGIRNIKKIIGDHTEFEIWFHKDLDGVTSALAMRHFLEKYYNLKLVDCHIIQYGGLEFAIKHGKPNTLKVLVDFAHSRPMFAIATDHHDKQVGAGDTGTYFKPARSNVETISGEISYSDVFTPGDIELIKTVDSANFLTYNITPEDVQNSIFQLKREESGEKNRFMMGFVVNRLLLAYKNKRISVRTMDSKRDHINKNILECMVLDCNPSLYSMYSNLRHYINNARVSDRAGVLAKPEVLIQNIAKYIERMKNYRFIEDPDTGEVTEFDPTSKKHQFLSTAKGAKVGKGVHFDDEYKIIMQYGGGNMIQPGSYDRYVPFKNFPEANFICIIWGMGLIQVSCNPFKEKKLKDINLGEIAKEVVALHQPILSKILISLDCIKKEFETSQDWRSMQKAIGDSYVGVGFKFSDLEAFYIDCIYNKQEKVSNILNKVLEIDFRANSEKYEDIDVIIDFNDKKYQFKITEIDSIKEFVQICGRLGLNAENKLLPFMKTNQFKESEPFISDISKKQIEGAKNNISNLLKSNELLGNGIVTKRDKITIFEGLEDSGLKDAMNTIYDNLSEAQLSTLKEYKIPVWELITRNSGGHPSITNLQGWGFLKYNKEAMNIAYGTDKYTDVMKKVAREFVDNLKGKIEIFEQGKSIEYNTKGVEFKGQDTNESYEFEILHSDGKTSKVSKDEFVNAGFGKAMRPERLSIDDKNKKIIAKFESFKSRK